MTTLDNYFDLWAEDSKIDRTELGEESIKIPQLHHKYYKMYSLERLNLVRLQEEMKILKKDKIEYYTGTMAEDDLKERGWEPNPLRILKTDIPVHMEADKDFVDLNLKLAYNKEKVEFLEAVVKTLNIEVIRSTMQSTGRSLR